MIAVRPPDVQFNRQLGILELYCQCNKCNVTAPITRFKKHKGRPYGVEFCCRDCCNKLAHSHRSNNRDRYRSNQNQWYHNNKNRLKDNLNAHRDLRRLKRSGLTQEKYLEILQMQNYACPICFSAYSKYSAKFHIDHDHKTGLVRGVLCPSCNIGLGHFKDKIDNLRRAVSYLSAYSEGIE